MEENEVLVDVEITIEGDEIAADSEILNPVDSLEYSNDISILNDTVDNSVLLESIEQYSIWQLYVLVLIFLILLIKGN